ncbi:hypothetical protein AYI68_g5158, partial [Smittium mucronatum]
MKKDQEIQFKYSVLLHPKFEKLKNS